MFKHVPATDEKKTTFSPQQVSFTISAPQGWLWWVVASLSFVVLMTTGGIIPFLFALFSMPSRVAPHFIEGARSLWLWVVGLVACASVVVKISTLSFTPTQGQYDTFWYQNNPVAYGLGIASVILAVFAALWIMSWAVPKNISSQENDVS